MGSSQILSITEENFDRLTFENSNPAVVLFSAERCRVCKILYVLLEDIVKDYQEKIGFYKVDVDQFGSLAQRFRLKGIPTLLLFKNGEITDRISGLHQKEELRKTLDKVLEP
jgi:thioredoxin 1